MAVFGLVGDAAEITVTPPLPVPPFVYVANLFDDTVSVIDTASNEVVETIEVGIHPHAIAITP